MSKEDSYIRDHLANERTFLAWIRTSIGIMAFGFVVEKFSLFMKQITFFLTKEEISLFSPGYSSILGITLVALGTLICLLAFIKYKRIEAQINAHGYRPTALLNIMLMLGVLLIGILLVMYLVHSL